MAIAKILITGHKGMIGRRLIAKLADNHDIQLLTFTGDLLEFDSLENFFAKHKPNKIIHLAGSFTNNLSKAVCNNILTTDNLIRLSVKYGVEQVIFSSSAAVYGDNYDAEINETFAVDPSTTYGFSKATAEEVLNAFAKKNNIQINILRFANVYDGINGKGVVAKFLNAVKENKPLIINGDGSQYRDFVHINDVCQAIELSLDYDQSDVFNISSPVHSSISELAEVISNKYRAEIKYDDSKKVKGGFKLNYKKAQADLGYMPNITHMQFDYML